MATVTPLPGAKPEKPLPLGSSTSVETAGGSFTSNWVGVGQSKAPPSARLSPTSIPASGRSGSQPDLNRAGRGSPDAPQGEGRKRDANTTPGTTLDAAWDRRLARGSVEPDATIDLHGHTLTSAYRLLDDALDRARLRGDRVILLVTGKPPRPDSERPHARGAIRAAVGDWLRASRHAGAIAAVRGASPRHGGSGALYIVLRRPRAARKS
jgi:DNA-nicking Smr family endonuclease